MNQTRMSLIIAAAGALLLIVAACDDSETIAPDGSTISINANPAQVILAGTPALQVNPITIVATVRNSIGVPLPGQDVRFTTTSGSLTPPALQPVTTDDLGNASCALTAATTGPNVTATSGKATASLQLTSANGEVAQILLNSDATDLTDCADTFELTATALDGSGVGVSGFTIIFQFAPSNPANAFTGNFNPTQGVSDTNGEVTATLSLNGTTCNSNCVGAGKDCRARIRAVSNGNLVISTELEILDQIP